MKVELYKHCFGVDVTVNGTGLSIEDSEGTTIDQSVAYHVLTKFIQEEMLDPFDMLEIIARTIEKEGICTYSENCGTCGELNETIELDI